MIVLDASAAIDWLLQTPNGHKIHERIYARAESLHCPHLLDLEVTQVLRRWSRDGSVTRERADEAIEDLQNLQITRYPHFPLLAQIWELRHNLSAYDAAYVAVADRLGATLLTRDARMASAVGNIVAVESF